jgi:T5orf172 domain
MERDTEGDTRETRPYSFPTKEQDPLGDELRRILGKFFPPIQNAGTAEQPHPGYVYMIRFHTSGDSFPSTMFKIGRTADPPSRIRLQVRRTLFYDGSPVSELEAVGYCGDMVTFEKAIHQELKRQDKCCLMREYFNLTLSEADLYAWPINQGDQVP